MTVSNVLDRAMTMASRPEYLDRAWLRAEMTALIARGEWAELGALGVHVALAAAPFGGDLLIHLSALAFAPREGAAWGDAGWVASEMGARVAAMTAEGSDLQATGLNLAAGCARVEVQP